MSQRHMPQSAKQFAQSQGNAGYNVGSAQSYEFDPNTAARSQSKLNRGSNAFVFNNQDIARERGRPNALSKETTGTVYGGAIGEQ